MSNANTDAITIVPMPENTEKLQQLVDDVLVNKLPRLWIGSRVDGDPYDALVEWLRTTHTTPEKGQARQVVLEHIKKVIISAIDGAANGPYDDPRLETALCIVDGLGDKNLARLSGSLIPQADNLEPDALEALIRVQRLYLEDPAHHLDFFLNLFPSRAGTATVGFQLLRLAVETGDSSRVSRTLKLVDGWCKTPDERKGLERLCERLDVQLARIAAMEAMRELAKRLYLDMLPLMAGLGSKKNHLVVYDDSRHEHGLHWTSPSCGQERLTYKLIDVYGRMDSTHERDEKDSPIDAEIAVFHNWDYFKNIRRLRHTSHPSTREIAFYNR